MPKKINKNDLNAEVEEHEGHSYATSEVAWFFFNVLNDRSLYPDSETEDFLAPLIEAMYLEGSSVMKPMCDADPMINDPDPLCM